MESIDPDSFLFLTGWSYARTFRVAILTFFQGIERWLKRKPSSPLLSSLDIFIHSATRKYRNERSFPRANIQINRSRLEHWKSNYYYQFKNFYRNKVTLSISFTKNNSSNVYPVTSGSIPLTIIIITFTNKLSRASLSSCKLELLNFGRCASREDWSIEDRYLEEADRDSGGKSAR